MKSFTYLLRGFTCLWIVFAGNSVLAQGAVKDTFDFYQYDSFKHNDSIDFISYPILENSDGSYSKLVSYGMNRDKYLFRYDSTMQFLDSTVIENYEAGSNYRVGGITYMKRNTIGYLITNMIGIYQYDSSNQIVWKIFLNYNLESVTTTPNGYAVIGTKVSSWGNAGWGTNMDTLCKIVSHISFSGNLLWEQKYRVLIDTPINYYGWYEDGIIYNQNKIYFAYMDSTEQRSPTPIFSSVVVKIDLSGNTVWQKHTDISAGTFKKNSKGIFIFGNEEDTTNTYSTYRMYKLDTSNGNVNLYLRYPNWGGLFHYHDTLWLHVIRQNYWVAAQNKTIITIEIINILGVDSVQLYYTSDYVILTDTTLDHYGPYPIYMDSKENLLTSLFVTKHLNYYSELIGTIFCKFVLRKDTVSVLPIKLITFTGMLRGDDVQLNWATATETNNDYFEVERSLDGKSFTKIGFVKGAGNSVNVQKYIYIDISAENEVLYYRLKQVDYDGTFSYSNIVVVKQNISSVKLYPNPFENYVTVYGHGDIVITDILGKIYFSDTVGNVQTTDWPTGVYLVQYLINGEVKKIIKN